MNLASWLTTIQALHPTAIDLGLERVRQVANAMGLTRPAGRVITVAGTNGKGSCVAYLESLLLAAGLRTGSYTSPHIHCYNERVHINGCMVSDGQLCESFEKIAAARGDVSLTYFEYGTLSALYLMEQGGLDVAILEVGLGGRLDAVNIIDADVCVISQIDLDHLDWLGPDRESVGREKAGIFRTGVPVVCGDPSPPLSLTSYALELGAPLILRGRDYDYAPGIGGRWSWWGRSASGHVRQLTDLPPLTLAPDHAATALQCLACLRLEMPRAVLDTGLAAASLPGRFELLFDAAGVTPVLLDVAHNPSAGQRLATGLQAYRRQHPETGKIAAVLAIMADKDVRGFCQALASQVDIWYIAQVDQPRAMPAQKLAELVDSMGLSRNVTVFADPAEAYRNVRNNMQPGDLVLVTGSFFTVASVRGALKNLPVG